jgi:uncharacterized protein (TIGR03435 family)
MRAALAFLMLLGQASSFEVVSIKPSDESVEATVRGTALRGNRWVATHVTLRGIMRDAYRTDGFDMPDRILGGPAWIEKDQFDITATTASARPAQPELEQLIRAMMRERFHLESHLEKRTLSAYELVLARNRALGSRLHRTDDDCGSRCGVSIFFGPPNTITSRGVDMKRFAFMLSSVARKAVIDRTGLSGHFELNLDFGASPGMESANVPPSENPDIFTALQEQLGLKLRSIKEPLDVLVVDRARTPAFD